jgi:hypothetical protein
MGTKRGEPRLGEVRGEHAWTGWEKQWVPLSAQGKGKIMTKEPKSGIEHRVGRVIRPLERGIGVLSRDVRIPGGGE